MKQCLMLETKSAKKFFTYEHNLPYLTEFSNVFDTEISIVKIPDEVEILELEELALRFCKNESVKTKNIIRIQTKNKVIKPSSEIRNYIEKNLLKGEIVSLEDLKIKFNKFTVGYLCNYYKKVRTELENKGYTFIKVGGGKYQAIVQPE